MLHPAWYQVVFTLLCFSVGVIHDEFGGNLFDEQSDEDPSLSLAPKTGTHPPFR